MENTDASGTFDYFGKLSWAEYTAEITEQQAENRKLLRNLMLSCGFKAELIYCVAANIDFSPNRK